MSQDDVEIVQRIFDAFNSEDIDLILSFTHPDFEVEVPADFSAEPDTYRGHDGMRRYWESFQDAMEEIRFQPERLWDAGQAVVVVMHVTAKGRQTAIPVEQRLVGLWTICDRKAMRVRVYGSQSEALRAVGLTEEACLDESDH
jgi:ketosteroid isomerase-like protein